MALDPIMFYGLLKVANWLGTGTGLDNREGVPTGFVERTWIEGSNGVWGLREIV